MPGQYVVDTHVLLWLLTDPGQLPEGTLAELRDRRSELFVSAASAWEIGTKHRLGKLPQADVLVGVYHRHLDRLGVTSVPISSEHSLLAGSLDWAHRDPFDRMIAAQCMIESLLLVTADDAFHTLAGIRAAWRLQRD